DVFLADTTKRRYFDGIGQCFQVGAFMALSVRELQGYRADSLFQYQRYGGLTHLGSVSSLRFRVLAPFFSAKLSTLIIQSVSRQHLKGFTRVSAIDPWI